MLFKIIFSHLWAMYFDSVPTTENVIVVIVTVDSIIEEGIIV